MLLITVCWIYIREGFCFLFAVEVKGRELVVLSYLKNLLTQKKNREKSAKYMLSTWL